MRHCIIVFLLIFCQNEERGRCQGKVGGRSSRFFISFFERWERSLGCEGHVETVSFILDALDREPFQMYEG